MTRIHEPNSLIELARALQDGELPQSESKALFDRLIEKKARTHGIPMTGSFELTPLCNLDCKMCYVHLNRTQFDQSSLLSVDTWKSLILQAHKSGMRNASLTGGECLIYPGFEELFLYFHSLGIRPGILSNGILINERIIDLFKHNPPRMIQISLYGSSDDAYERVTGHKVFNLVYRNLLMLRDSGLPVKITITPNAFMRDDFLPLLETAHSLNIPTNINANLIPPRKNTGRIVQDLSIDEYVEIFKLNSRLKNNEPAPLESAELPDESHEETKQYGLRCGAGRSSFGIKYDGSMCPCLSLGEISIDTLKNGFDSAWKQVNAIANSFPLPLECGTCVYRDHCLPCIAMHKNAGIDGHCDTRICERTKKLMAAGFIPLMNKNEENKA